MSPTTFMTTDGVELVGDLVVPDEPVGAAVLCHPHPSYGGSRRAWMMPVLERALSADGWATLRFDFRGAGDSSGEHGGGAAEVADVEAAISLLTTAALTEEAGASPPLVLVGWSFGAHVSLRCAVGSDRVDGWAGIALPVGVTAPAMPAIDAAVLATCTARKLLLHGTEDQFTSLDELRQLHDAMAEPKRLHVIEGGDHFLGRHGDVLSREVRSFARAVLSDVSGGS